VNLSKEEFPILVTDYELASAVFVEKNTSEAKTTVVAVDEKVLEK
jgi:hypothetical protein